VTGAALAAGAARITDGLELLVSAPGCGDAAAEQERGTCDRYRDGLVSPPHESALLPAAAACSSATSFSLARPARPMPSAMARMPMISRVIGCLGVTTYVPGWSRGTPASRVASCRSYSC
jgi:hypothetical protein